MKGEGGKGGILHRVEREVLKAEILGQEDLGIKVPKISLHEREICHHTFVPNRPAL